MAKLGDFIPDPVTSPRQWISSVFSIVVLSLVVGVGLFVVSQIRGRVPGAAPWLWTPQALSPAQAPPLPTGPIFRTYGV